MFEKIEKRLIDNKKADLVEKLIDSNLKEALNIAEEIEDLEAKSMAFLHLFNLPTITNFWRNQFTMLHALKRKIEKIVCY